MPTLGGIITAGESAYGVTHFGYLQNVDSNSTVFNSHVESLVPDETVFPDQGQAANTVTLRDFVEGQDWFLKRIVGKLAIACCTRSTATDGDTSWPNVLVGAGFFVAKAEDNNPEQPDLEVQEYDPLGSENVRQPWIWRRTYVLTDSNITTPGGNPTRYPVFTTNNLLLASGLDGPHIDAKTARRIRREERLWFVTTMTPFHYASDSGGSVSASTMQVSVNLDYRILGAMRRSTNRSTFG